MSQYGIECDLLGEHMQLYDGDNLDALLVSLIGEYVDRDDGRHEDTATITYGVVLCDGDDEVCEVEHEVENIMHVVSWEKKTKVRLAITVEDQAIVDAEIVE